MRPRVFVDVAQGILGRRNLTDAWKIELELGNKEDLAEIGRAKRKETEGRPAKELLSNNDNSLPEPKHDTRKAIARVAQVSHDTLAKRFRLEAVALAR